MADRDPLVMTNDEELEHLDDTYYMYLNKSTFLYGSSNTGKTVIVKHILEKLRPYIPTVFLICPSELANNSYLGIVPRAAVYYDATIALLKAIFARQELSAQIYEKSNNFESLESLYLKCTNSRVDYLLAKLEERYNRAVYKAENIRDSGQQYEEKKLIKEKYDDARKIVFRKQISVNIDKIDKGKLSRDEELTLRYINFNPHLLLIFDDYAAGLKKFKDTEIMKNYMYRGRHNKITILIVNHSCTDLPPSIRSNAFNIIFGSAEIAQAYFIKSSGNGFTSEQYKRVKMISEKVYEEKDKRKKEHWRKFVWVREGASKNYYYFLADILETKMFGGDEFIELCTKGAKDQNSIDTSNPFFNNFMNS